MSNKRKTLSVVGICESESHSTERYAFLSPAWVDEVVRVVETAKKNDPLLRGRISDYSLTIQYIIQHVPPHIQRWSSGDGQAEIFVQLDRGSVRRVAMGRKPAKTDVDLIVTVEYEVAKKLFLGRLSPAVSFINRRVKAKPANGFRNWPKLAARSIVTGSMILKLARKVPTQFEPQG